MIDYFFLVFILLQSAPITGPHKWLAGVHAAKLAQAAGQWAIVCVPPCPPLLQVELHICAPDHCLHGPIPPPGWVAKPQMLMTAVLMDR